MKKTIKVECWVCGDMVDVKKTNGIYGRFGQRWYCPKKKCQKTFIEDAEDVEDAGDTGLRDETD